METKEYNHIGEYIEELKREKGPEITYKKMAKAAGVDGSHINRIVKGHRTKINFNAVVRLIDYLGGDVQLASELVIKQAKLENDNQCEEVNEDEALKAFKKFLDRKGISIANAKTIINLYSKWKQIGL